MTTIFRKEEEEKRDAVPEAKIEDGEITIKTEDGREIKKKAPPSSWK
jgi:hypothetical protein